MQGNYGVVWCLLGIGVLACGPSEGSVVVDNSSPRTLSITIDGDLTVEVAPNASKKIEKLKVGNRNLVFSCSGMTCSFWCLGCNADNKVCTVPVKDDEVPTIVATKGSSDSNVKLSCPNPAHMPGGSSSSCTGTTHRCNDGSCCNVCCGSGGGCC